MHLSVNKATFQQSFTIKAGVWISFCLTLSSSSEFSLPKSGKQLLEGKKPLARLASGFVILLSKPKFYSHLASWQVIIRTPNPRFPLVLAEVL
jgi:hypothetical protein